MGTTMKNKKNNIATGNNNANIKTTIERIALLNAKKLQLDSTAHITEKKTTSQTALRRRVLKKSSPISPTDRKHVMQNIVKDMMFGNLTQGEALKALRLNILSLKQEAFANLVSVSRKTISDIENDKGNYSSHIINKVFKPFGLKVSLVPTSLQMMKELLME